MKKKILLSICIIMIILLIIAIILIKNDKLKIGGTPTIYYIHEDGLKMPLLASNKTFSNSTKITWPKSCTGIIKKDGEEFSKENGTTITDEGVYEITITTIITRKTVTKTLKIDKTPPSVEIKGNSSGIYIVTFKDVSDVGVAILTKFDLDTMELVSEIDLRQNGLPKSIEITEKGYYELRIEDYYGNLVSENTKFNIK